MGLLRSLVCAKTCRTWRRGMSERAVVRHTLMMVGADQLCLRGYEAARRHARIQNLSASSCVDVEGCAPFRADVPCAELGNTLCHAHDWPPRCKLVAAQSLENQPCGKRCASNLYIQIYGSCNVGEDDDGLEGSIIARSFARSKHFCRAPPGRHLAWRAHCLARCQSSHRAA